MSMPFLKQLENRIKELENNQVIKIENSNGIATKFPDGTMICRKIINLSNIDINTAWGSFYMFYQNLSVRNYFAQAFIETPVISLSTGTENGFGMWIGDYGTMTVTKSYFTGICLVRPTAATNVNAEIHMIAIGKWK